MSIIVIFYFDFDITSIILYNWHVNPRAGSPAYIIHVLHASDIRPPSYIRAIPSTSPPHDGRFIIKDAAHKQTTLCKYFRKNNVLQIIVSNTCHSLCTSRRLLTEGMPRRDWHSDTPRLLCTRRDLRRNSR